MVTNKKSKFLSPPEGLEQVLVQDFVLSRKKKRTLKLVRQAHTPSKHLLNLQKNTHAITVASRPEVKNFILREAKRPDQPRSWTLNLDAEKTYNILRSFFSKWKSAMVFFVIGLMFIFSVQAVNWVLRVKRADYQVLARSTEGLVLLKTGAKLLFTNPAAAELKFQSSSHNFLLAKDDVLKLNSYHLRLLGGKKIDAALAVAKALKNISEAVRALSQTDAILPSVEQAQKSFVLARDNANTALQLEPSRPEIKELHSLIGEHLTLLEDLAVLLGRDNWKRYLVLFQNNTEIRATGGFIGSFAVLDVDRGQMKQLDIPKGGSYDLQGDLKVAIAPPQPLQLVKSRWEFQDANWFPDFPTSAVKVAWFYEKADQRTVDGVIALNTNLLIDLLKITGPIEMPAYHRVIDADNFLLETQKIVELEYDRKINQPKEFIGDLAAVMLEKLKKLPRDQYKSLLDVLLSNLDKKNIMLFATDTKIEDYLNRFGWGGRLKQIGTKEDYLGIIHTNIAGQKTDQMMNETVTYRPSIGSDGSVTVKLSIARTHEGKKGELFRGVRNVDYLRVYVPEEATFISAEGFDQPPAFLFKNPSKDLGQGKNVVAEENAFAVDLKSQTLIYNQFGKTVFANWLQVDPGHTVTATLVYKLPFKVTDQYQLFVEKQSGVRPQNFRVELASIYNEARPISDVAVPTDTSEASKTIWSFLLGKDQALGVKFKIPYLAD